MLLAVDTSTQWMGLALYDDELIIGEITWRTQNHHSVELTPAVESLLKRSGIKVKDLNVLAVATGPGSFTSLRIGMAFIKGLALTLNLPVIGIPTLDITVAAVPIRDMALVAVLQAGRGRLAVGKYSPTEVGWKKHGDPVVMTPAELEQDIKKPTLICGELNTEERKTLARRWKNIELTEPALSVRRPAYLAQLAWNRWQSMDVDDVVTLSPTYLHYKETIPG